MRTAFHSRFAPVFMRRVFLLAFALAAVSPVLAQQVPDSLCTYDACALRVEPAFLGARLVRGTEGIPVAGLGLFSSNLSEVVAPSERALEHARIYDRTRTPAALTALGAGLLLAFGSAATNGDAFEVSDGVALGALLGGVGLGVVSIRLSLRSRQAFSRALWWYNRDLPR